MNTENQTYSIYRLSRNGSVIKTKALDEKLSCALGCFDGVHMGHRILIETAKINFLGYTPAIWTFSEPLCKPFVENIPERLSLCGRLGVETAICEDFESVRDMTPRQFVLHLHEHFGVRHFICGKDFRFGKDREGDAQLLQKLALELGDVVTVTPTVMLNALLGEAAESDEKVSSSALRKMISEGELEKASAVLGRRFGVTASVCEGKQIGRAMGMPTINQQIEDGRVIPAFGVYYSVAIYDGEEHFAVTNIGVRPTVNNGSDVTCETHILDVNADLYGKTVRVELCKYARGEKKFANIDELKNAIAGDICGAKAYFGIDP